MNGLGKKSSKKSGLSPGTLIYTGRQKVEKTRISVIDYDGKKFTEKVVKKVDECFPFSKTPTVTWINIEGLHEVDVIEKIGRCFNVHPLILEDILNTDQRPKMEEFDDFVFVVLKMIYHDEIRKRNRSEQVSLIVGRNFVLSFQETIGDVFNPIRNRIRSGKGLIRKSGPDYLAYSLIDAIVDNYFPILETIGEKIEGVEDKIFTKSSNEIPSTIHHLKRDVIYMRKAVWPLREVVNSLERMESKIVKDKTRIYFRDVYDHIIRVMDSVDLYKDMLASILELYMINVSNKLNQIMQVLTMIATIFIPLGFIASLYGMNFSPDSSPLNMPELRWYFGYPFALLVMLIVGVIMLFYFRKKGWI